HFNFVGNIEGGDIFRGMADVIVCDGFVGNVILKVSEGLADSLMRLIKQEIKESIFFQSAAMLLKPAFKNLRKKIDYDEYGGAPLLGINGISTICHGGSNPKAIKNAIRIACRLVNEKINQNIIDEIDVHCSITKSAEERSNGN
ncbi:MAG: phosphate--acyl-ACP acyltransferase, partial [bacterium]